MSEDNSLHGLTCPNCGGVIPIPEGQLIVQCPYCDLRSFVRGDRGVLRYQVPLRIKREAAETTLRKFLSGKMAIARNASRTAQLQEAFVVHLPFWTIWSRVGGWVFGQKKVGSGDNTRYEPREMRIVQDVSWNGAACDVGEFGVVRIPLINQPLEPFNPESLHNSGLVFEPVNSASEARQAAENQFRNEVQHKAGLNRISQVFMRTAHNRFGLVYYPLWVLRYHYRQRVFQVVLDGHTGQVLYGKAPGNTVYRAAVLVAGMAVGAFLSIDVPSFILSFSDQGEGAFTFGCAMFVLGLGIMAAAYRTFRRGEQYEYRENKPGLVTGFDTGNPLEVISQVKDIEKWIDQLS